MELRQLEHFLAIVDHGSIGRAAQHLALSQPALTQSLRRLERRLDVALLERGPHGVSLTEAGTMLVPRARTIALEARLAAAEVDASTGRMRGQLRVGSGPSLAADLVPYSVAQLLGRHPKLQVTIREGTLDSLLPALERGQLDLVIGTQPEAVSLRGMQTETLLRDQMIVAARATHPLANRRALPLKETLAWPWVLPVAHEVVRSRAELIFNEAGIGAPVPAVETDSAASIRSLLAAGDFLSFIPLRLVASEIQEGALVALDIATGPWTRMVHVAYRSAALQPAGRLFISLLRRGADARGSAPAGAPRRGSRDRHGIDCDAAGSVQSLDR